MRSGKFPSTLEILAHFGETAVNKRQRVEKFTSSHFSSGEKELPERADSRIVGIPTIQRYGTEATQSGAD